jgi:hypothetical protein
MPSLTPDCVGVRQYSEAAVLRLRLVTARRAAKTKKALAGVRTCVLFVGCPRSGHSFVGALVDAHPHAVVAHELDLLGFVERGFSWPQLGGLVFENARQFAAAGRTWEGYSYQVPGTKQGEADPLLVIGDKKGLRTTRRLTDDPALLDRLGTLVPAALRLVHVVRNPYDIIATRHKRSGAALDTLIARTETVLAAVETISARAGADRVYTMRHEDVIADPRRELALLASFLGLTVDAPWLEACAAVVFPKVRRTRGDAPWTPAQVERVRALIARTRFLAGYGFD